MRRPNRNEIRSPGQMVLYMILCALTLLAADAQAYRRASLSNACCANMKQLEGAKATWCLETKFDPEKNPGYRIKTNDLIGATRYIRNMPLCPAEGVYDFQDPMSGISCSLHGTIENLVRVEISPRRARIQWRQFWWVAMVGSALVLLTLRYRSGFGLPEKYRLPLLTGSTLLAALVTIHMLVSRGTWQSYYAFQAAYCLTLFFSGRVIFQKQRRVRVVGWIVGSIFVFAFSFLKIVG